MKIGELAGKTGTQAETIRLHEREGLLPVARRSQGNYRVYDLSHASRLSFIRHCRSLDMTLAEIRVLLRFKDAPGKNCAEVNTLLDEHIGHVVERIRELRLLERQLNALRAMCHETQEAARCGILNELGNVMSETAMPTARAVAHVAGAHGGSRSRRCR